MTPVHVLAELRRHGLVAPAGAKWLGSRLENDRRVFCFEMPDGRLIELRAPVAKTAPDPEKEVRRRRWSFRIVKPK